MILDNQATYGVAQAVTATGDTASANSYDHGPGNAGPGLGYIGGPWLIVKAVQAPTSGGAATIQAVLQDSADNTTFADVMALGPAVAVTSVPANRTLAAARFPGTLRRYTRVVYRVGTATLTAGTFSAFVAEDIDNQQYLPSGFRAFS